MKQAKFRFNFLFILLCSGLLLFGRGPFLVSSAMANEAEVHDEADLNELLNRYHKDQEKILNDYSKLNEAYDANSIELGEQEIADEYAEEIRKAIEKNGSKLPFGKVNKKPIKNKDVSHKLSQDLNDSLKLFANYSDRELKDFFKANLKSSKVGELLENNPRVLNVIVRLVKDEKALPEAIKVIEDRKVLVWFGSAMLCSIIFGFITKRIFYDSNSSFFRVIFGFIGHFIFMTGVRIAIIVFFFGNHLGPAFKIIVQEVLKKS